MNLLLVALLYGSAAAITGEAVAWCLCWSHFHRKTRAQNSAESRHVAEVLSPYMNWRLV